MKHRAPGDPVPTHPSTGDPLGRCVSVAVGGPDFAAVSFYSGTELLTFTFTDPDDVARLRQAKTV